MCCGRANRTRSVSNSSGPCKLIEESGAALKLWPKNVGGRFRLLVKNESGSFIDALAFITANACSGPASKVVVGNANHVLSAAAKNPAPFLNHSASGLSLVGLLQLADQIHKVGRARDGRKLHTNPSR